MGVWNVSHRIMYDTWAVRLFLKCTECIETHPANFSETPFFARPCGENIPTWIHSSEVQWTVLELVGTMRMSRDDRHRSPKNSPGQPLWPEYACLDSQGTFDV